MSCELPEWDDFSYPKARKQYKCCECRGEISAGERYWKFVGVWDGDFQSYRMCSDCRALMREVDKGQSLDDQCGFMGLLECCSEIGDEYLSHMHAIMVKRNAVVPGWITERLEEKVDA